MKYSTLLAVLAIAVLTIACNEERTTESGVKVRIVEKGEGTPLQDSTILRMNMKYVNANGNEHWNSDKAGGPVAMQYLKEVWGTLGPMYEAFETLNVGDSGVFDISVAEFYKNSMKGAVIPDSLDSASNMTFYVKIVSMMTVEEFQEFRKQEYEKAQAKAQEQKRAMMAERLAKLLEETVEARQKDGEDIDKFLTENNITATTTESGMRYNLTQAGDGEFAKPGDRVTVHYHGTFMDGTKFDSSYDRDQPFIFVLGQGDVIPGWDEGIALLNKGAKATFYIPSSLAYGERGRGGIPANSILFFDVELLEIN